MLGISTFCLHSEPLLTALDKLSPLTRLIEVMDEGMHYLDSSMPLQSYSNSFSIHAPSRGVNLASQLEPIRRASVEVTRECMDIASDVGGQVIVHPGYFAWPEERQNSRKQFIISKEELLSASVETSVPLYFENMGNWDYFFLKRPDELEMIAGAGFALDVGHAHENGCLTDFLSVPINHFHLHDNNGKMDEHLAINEGTINFPEVIDSIRRNNANSIIESRTFEKVLKSLDILKERFQFF